MRETAVEGGTAIFDTLERWKEKGTESFAAAMELLDAGFRLYRNFRDHGTIEDLGLTIHVVKENTVLFPESRSSDQLMHDIKVALARNYVRNLSEEVRKGLREKADQGISLAWLVSATSTTA